MDYDANDNARKCYELAIKTLRERHQAALVSADAGVDSLRRAIQSAQRVKRNDIPAVTAIIIAIDDLLEAKQFDLLDEVISEEVPVLCRDAVVPLTVLRTTFAVRDRLPGWGLLLIKFKCVLEQRGMDAEKILRGLAP